MENTFVMKIDTDTDMILRRLAYELGLSKAAVVRGLISERAKATGVDVRAHLDAGRTAPTNRMRDIG